MSYIDPNLKIVLSQHLPWAWEASFDISGVSISGFGRTRDEAVIDLFTRLLYTAQSHMAAVLRELGINPDELNLSFEWTDDFESLVISSAQGQRKTILKKVLEGLLKK